MGIRKIRKEIEELKPWFHYFEIKGIPTKDGGEGELPPLRYPENLWEFLKPHLPRFLAGKRGLDIGCNAGWFSVQLVKRGAYVLGVDSNQDCRGCRGDAITQAKFIKNHLLNKGEQYRFDVSERDFFEKTPPLNFNFPFDLILFLGVYYHLKEPHKSFPTIRPLLKQGGLLYVESAMGARSEYFDGKTKVYHDDPTNYYVPSKGDLIKELRDNGFSVSEIPTDMKNRILLKCVKK